MSRSRWFPLFVSSMALAIGSTPAWAQHRGGGNGGGWPPRPVHADAGTPVPGNPQSGRDRDMRNPPSMEASIRPRPTASDCGRSMALSPGDQILAVQPMDFGGRVQCRVKIMGADGMVRVMMVSPGL
ncbi:MAG: hypothetical protein JF567_07930 [Xanthomonadales bacterium]|nr:hypothetical protein [Xanthomonadales bacterium]